MDLLREAVNELRETQLTADNVVVLVAKMAGGVLVAGAAIAAIVGGVITIT